MTAGVRGMQRTRWPIDGLRRETVMVPESILAAALERTPGALGGSADKGAVCRRLECYRRARRDREQVRLVVNDDARETTTGAHWRLSGVERGATSQNSEPYAGLSG